MSETAGKAVSLVMRSSTGTGVVRIAPRLMRNQAVLEVLDIAGGITQMRLTPDELRRLAQSLLKVSALLESTHLGEETTQP